MVIVSTADKNGRPNASPKGIVKIDKDAIYFLDLFYGKTRNNLTSNKFAAISVVDVNEFTGFQFKGRVTLINKGKLFNHMVKLWDAHKTGLVVERIIRNVHRGMSGKMTEQHLPRPKYLVKLGVEEIHNLIPPKLRN